MEKLDPSVAQQIARATRTRTGPPQPHPFCRPSSPLTCVVAGATMPSCLVLSDW